MLNPCPHLDHVKLYSTAQGRVTQGRGTNWTLDSLMAHLVAFMTCRVAVALILKFALATGRHIPVYADIDIYNIYQQLIINSTEKYLT